MCSVTVFIRFSWHVTDICWRIVSTVSAENLGKFQFCLLFLRKKCLWHSCRHPFFESLNWVNIVLLRIMKNSLVHLFISNVINLTFFVHVIHQTFSVCYASCVFHVCRKKWNLLCRKHKLIYICKNKQILMPLWISAISPEYQRWQPEKVILQDLIFSYWNFTLYFFS